MVVASVIAMVIMIVSVGPVASFVQRHPTVKMLALAFPLPIGVTLVADGLQFHRPRGCIYFTVALPSVSKRSASGATCGVVKRIRRDEDRAVDGAFIESTGEAT